MQKERAWWIVIIGLIVMVGLSAFFAGSYYTTLRMNTKNFANLELQLGMLQDENRFLMERDLQLIDELDDLRDAIQDLELWMETTLGLEIMEAEARALEKLQKSETNFNSRISSFWSRIYDIEEDIRFLRCELGNCTYPYCEYCDGEYYCPRCGSYWGP